MIMLQKNFGKGEPGKRQTEVSTKLNKMSPIVLLEAQFDAVFMVTQLGKSPWPAVFFENAWE